MSRRGRDYAEARDHRPQASQCKDISFQWGLIKGEMKRRGQHAWKGLKSVQSAAKADTSRRLQYPGGGARRTKSLDICVDVEARGSDHLLPFLAASLPLKQETFTAGLSSSSVCLPPPPQECSYLQKDKDPEEAG